MSCVRGPLLPDRLERGPGPLAALCTSCPTPTRPQKQELSSSAPAAACESVRFTPGSVLGLRAVFSFR